MDIEELKEELKKELGEDYKIIEAHVFDRMTLDAIEKMSNLFDTCKEENKRFIERFVPTGHPVDFYIGIIQSQRIVMEWIPREQLALEPGQWISLVNLRTCWIVNKMSPRDKRHFCTILNSIGTNIDPSILPQANGSHKANEN